MSRRPRAQARAQHPEHGFSTAAVAGALWRRKLVALLLAALVALVGAVLLSQQEETYESQVTVALLPKADATGSTTESLPFYPEAVRSMLPTYTQVVESGVVLEQVRSSLGPTWSLEELKDAVYVRTVPNSAVVEVVARDTEPRTSAEIAQLTARAFIGEVDKSDVLAATVLDRAQVPQKPVAPNRPLSALAILLVALTVGAVGALGFDRLFGRVRTPRHLEEVTGLPVLAVLSEDERLTGSAPRIVAGEPGMGALTEDVRTLHANLLLALREQPHSLVAVTSLGDGEGKSTVTANLGLVLAQYGRQTLVLDADHADPAQERIFELTGERAALGADLHFGGQLHPQTTRHPRLAVVAANGGAVDATDAVLQQLPRFGQLADIVLVDTPALEDNADARLLVGTSGAALLVVRAGSSNPRRLQAAVRELDRLGADVLGVVLTQVSGRTAKQERAQLVDASPTVGPASRVGSEPSVPSKV